jgi:hypothetical protein
MSKETNMKTTALIIAASLIGASAAMAAESTPSNSPANDRMPSAAGSQNSGTEAAEAGKTMDSDPTPSTTAPKSQSGESSGSAMDEAGKTSTSDPAPTR